VQFATSEMPGVSGTSFEDFQPLPGDRVRLHLADGDWLAGQNVFSLDNLLAGAWVLEIPCFLWARRMQAMRTRRSGCR
jgi:hypothetical protein